MSADNEATRMRRYLIGASSEAERAAVEAEYFSREDAIDALAAAEDALIEEYLDDRLPPDERRQFEREYLSSSDHRRRVDTIRRLIDAAANARASSSALGDVRSEASASVLTAGLTWRPAWIALAASLVLAIALWVLLPKHPAENRAVAVPPAPAEPSPAVSPDPQRSAPSALRLYAVSLSPLSVRSADQSASVVIPAGTDVVSLRLEGDPGTAAPGQRTILIRTVTGDEIWRGQAIEEADRSAGTAARVDVPAPRLVTDDYVIELDIANREGVARELYRYFLRVRDR